MYCLESAASDGGELSLRLSWSPTRSRPPQVRGLSAECNRLRRSLWIFQLPRSPGIPGHTVRDFDEYRLLVDASQLHG